MCHILLLFWRIPLNAWLLSGEVAAAVVAGSGIIWEMREGGAAFKKIAQACVVWGVVAETAFTVALFWSEQSENNALESRLAARTLSDSQIEALKAAIAPFGAHQFHIETYWYASEPAALAKQLGNEVLIPTDWSQIQDRSVLAGVIAGVLVFQPRADLDPTGLAAAGALVAALKAANIDATLLPFSGVPQIDIEVGIKP